MARFLTTKGIAFFFEDLFKSSEEYVYVVSPYLKLDPLLEERIIESAQSGLKITLIYGKDEGQIGIIKDEIRNNIEILYYENLHAKLYVNEKHALITSMNLHAYSQSNNREIGVLLSRGDQNDMPAFKDCIKEFESIKKAAKPVNNKPIVDRINDKSVQKNPNSKNSTNTSVFESLKGIIADVLDVVGSEITPQSMLRKDLGADDIYLVELVALIEKFYKIEIPFDVIERTKTVNQLVDIVDRIISQKKTSDDPVAYFEKTHEKIETEWVKYLIRHYSGIISFSKYNDVIGKNFPTNNIDFSLEYGFITLTFNFSDSLLNKMQGQWFNEVRKKMANYRVFWNKPNRISVYDGKYVRYKSSSEHIQYYSDGLLLIIGILKNLSI